MRGRIADRVVLERLQPRIELLQLVPIGQQDKTNLRVLIREFHPSLDTVQPDQADLFAAVWIVLTKLYARTL